LLDQICIPRKEGTMSKKITLLALVAAGVAAFVLPATAMAAEEDVPLHLIPKPEGTKLIDGGAAALRGSFGSVTCTSSSGTATFSSTTTGTLTQRFSGCTAFGGSCQTPGQLNGVIVTTSLEFHLLTVEDSFTRITGPGVLVTPNVNSKGEPHFATFQCSFFGEFVVRGNGLIGTIIRPACGESSEGVTFQFSPMSAGSSLQTHRTVVGTSTEYFLRINGGESSEEASASITLGLTEAQLQCT
jgi:hypothetical protein